MVNLKSAIKENISYDLKGNELTAQDKARTLKLAKIIEEGESIAASFRPRIFSLNYDTNKILKTKITYEGEEFTLLHHAIYHKNNGAVKDLLKKAKDKGLLKAVLNEEVIIKCSDGKVEKHDPFSYAESCENGEAKDAILRAAQDGKILGDILKPNKEPILSNTTTATEEPKDTYTLEDIEEALGECKEVLDVENPSNNAVDQDADADAEIESCKNVSQDSESPQSEHKNSKDNQNTLKKQKSSIPKSLSSELYSESYTENSQGEKSPKNLPQSIAAGVVGAGLLASCITLYIMKMPVVAVALGIVGLTCAGFALYNLLKPKTKFEEMKDVKQHTAQPLRSFLCC
ncbi:WD_0033/WD_0034 family tandem repeat-containing protein [Wolbachia endosymbiont of Ctenocephalides felis wCfeJ]|uniref:WD_0033/WD_0034 family tandem repeat-containing protein n=1 Tax=Wolbachia endosymbiont of Ctenocephalides felis wCfeJ TaxID=2732594 RepID=UPI001447866E|nr:hypothetical protein [Wolbachia endosymbiont of Ctenocephalides felis wCfeJ]WCR58203.1 MAG: hypothetical protein PG980_000675 [Wolbachia endosymbiont of Ctenocephalides felis wCfeJ]